MLQQLRTIKRMRARGLMGMNCRNVDFINRYNERKLYPLVDNKLKTKLLAQEYGVSTPALRFVVSQQHEVKRALAKLAELDNFVLKPAQGSGGKGILVVTAREGDEFIKSSGVRIGFNELSRHMSNTLAGLYSLGGSPDQVIVEDLIQFDESLSDFSYEGVPDIRVIAFRGYPVMAMMRLATHASDGKANLHQGAVGVGLAIDSGACLNAVQYGRPIQEHPDTGHDLGRIEVPNWREILMLAARCHDMTGLGFLGTDVVLDKIAGPQLLELNARPGLAIQIANGTGLLPRLRHIEGLPDSRRWSASQRVDYVMRQFRVEEQNPDTSSDTAYP